MVLHQHRRLDPREMGSGRDPHPLLFLGQPDQDHLRILLRQADQMHEPRLGKHREQPDPVRLEGVIDHLGVERGDRHGSNQESYNRRVYTIADGEVREGTEAFRRPPEDPRTSRIGYTSVSTFSITSPDRGGRMGKDQGSRIESAEELAAALRIAAELEHGLCCQYLFTAFSLRRTLEDFAGVRATK